MRFPKITLSIMMFGFILSTMSPDITKMQANSELPTPPLPSDHLPSGALIFTDQPNPDLLLNIVFSQDGPQTKYFPSHRGEIMGIWATVTTNVKGAVLYFDINDETYKKSIGPNSNTLITFSSNVIVSNVRISIQDRGYQDDQANVAYLVPSQSLLGDKILVDDTGYSIPYIITNANILTVEPNTQTKSLVVYIHSDSYGMLIMTLPRGLIDSKVANTNQDEKYFVLLDGQKTDFQEMDNTVANRTLAFPFTSGTEKIEIIGTQIIPDFSMPSSVDETVWIISYEDMKCYETDKKYISLERTPPEVYYKTLESCMSNIEDLNTKIKKCEDSGGKFTLGESESLDACFCPSEKKFYTFSYYEDETPFEGCPRDKSTKAGGCLIATATYGSELATQVQLLREVRDNVLFNTKSGSAFMAGFNQFYYSFSPTIADWERQNPTFKGAIKITIIPMMSTLSILNYVNIDSESEMLGYGIGIILLNLGIYLIVPTIIIIKGKEKLISLRTKRV